MTGRPDIHEAALVSEDLLTFLSSQPSHAFRLHSAFKRSLNLQTEQGQLVTLTEGQGDLVPMGLTLSGRRGNWSLKAGEEWIYEDETFLLPGGRARIRLGRAQIRRTCLDGPLATAGQGRGQALGLIRQALLAWQGPGLAELAAILPLGDDRETARPLNLYSAYILNDLSLFLRALKVNDLDRAGELTGRLVGFGPGLTPSCDDFLSAILLSLFYEADPGRHPGLDRFLETVCLTAQKRTNLVSSQMLCHAARGYAAVSHLEVLEALFRGDLDAMPQLISNLLAYGASSGADFLLGLYCAGVLMPPENVAGGRAQEKYRPVGKGWIGRPQELIVKGECQ